MKTKDWLLAIIEAVLWFIFLYYLLYAIQNQVKPFRAALILLVVGYLATLACPWFRNTSAWRRMLGKKD